MSNFQLLADEPMVSSLALTLLHFLWQGALVVLIGSVLRWRVDREDVHLRYRISCGSLVLMGMFPLLTFMILHSGSPPLTKVAFPPVSIATGLPVLAGDTLASSIHNWFPAIVAVWLAGVTVLSLRLIWSWGMLSYFRRKFTEPLSEAWQETAIRLASRLKVSAPSFLQSRRLESPIVFGWLRPAVVLPVAALSGLHPTQIEALLAHELMHLHRRDHIVNAAQMLLETLFFYHPATWWISRLVRADRELCCDREAAMQLGDRRSYLQALARMEEIRQSSVPVLSVGIRDGELLNRVRMLISLHPSDGDAKMKRSRFQFGALAGIVSLFVIAMMTLGSIAPALSADSGSASVENIQKVGYIDSQALRERLPEFKTVLRELESLQRKYEQEAVERRNSILKLEEDFKEQEPLLSETRKVEMQAKIEERVRGLQEFTQSKFGPDGELFRHNVELSSPILERVKAMVQVLAKEEGYDAIHDVAIDSATVNADSERHNLTTKLLERLGKTQKMQQENDAGRISVSVMQDGSIGLSAQTSVSSIEMLTSLLKELGVQFDVEHIDVASIANPDESHTLKVMEAVRSAGLEPRPAPTTNMESLQRVPAKLLVHLPQPDSVRVVVYNVQGGEVLTLYEDQSAQGDHTFTWDGKDSAGNRVGAGMYFVRVSVGESKGARMYKVLVE